MKKSHISLLFLLFLVFSSLISCNKDFDKGYTYQKNGVTHFVFPVTLEIENENYKFFYESDYLYFLEDYEVTTPEKTVKLSSLKSGTRLWVDTSDAVIEGSKNHFEIIYEIKLR